MLEQFKQLFIEEVIDLLNNLEKSLLILEKNHEDKELIREVFRIMHTIKGSAGMYDLKKTVEVTHKLESIYASIRDNKSVLTPQILTLTFQSIDFIRELITKDSENSADIFKINDFINQVQNVVDKIENFKKSSTNDEKDSIIEFFDKEETPVIELFENSDKDVTETGETYYIIFKPDNDINRRGINLKKILDEIENFEFHKIITHFYTIDEIIGTKFYLFWEIFISTSEVLESIKDIFVFVQEEVEIIKISDTNLLKNTEFCKKIETIFDENYIIEKSEFDKILEIYNEKKQKIETKTIEIKSENTQQNNNILEHQIAISEQKTSSIKVASEKLDELMNLVSELVTTKAELDLFSESIDNELLNTISEKFDKIINSLRNNALSIRLIPIESVMLRFERLVRDLSNELGKQVDFQAEGTETELDKNIIDNLSVPLMHIIRNAVDHGIETVEKRRQLGKTDTGIIRFIAFYSGANVFIQVRDDGAGINAAQLKAKAIEKGFISSEQNYSTKEIFNLIFLPGFSTAQKITGISGRGVGMDVVKKTIIDLRGEIEIDSEINLGTSVTIKLPLTLSIVDTLLVSIENSKLLIPLSYVDSCAQILHSQIADKENKRLNFYNELIPYIHLREKFFIKGNPPEYESIIFVKYKDSRVALIFDSIIGEHQAVLKPLGDIFIKQEFISGGSILGDGSVALILDTNKLIKQYT